MYLRRKKGFSKYKRRAGATKATVGRRKTSRFSRFKRRNTGGKVRSSFSRFRRRGRFSGRRRIGLTKRVEAIFDRKMTAKQTLMYNVVGIVQPSGTASTNNVAYNTCAKLLTVFDLLNIQHANENSAPNSAGSYPTIGKACRFRVNESSCHFTLQNQSTGHAIVTLYYVMPRFDTWESNVGGLWEVDMITKIGTNRLDNDAQTEATTGAALETTNIAYQPYNSADFTARYKIYKQKKYYMRGGQTVHGSLSSKREHSFNSSRWRVEEATSESFIPSALAGHTKFVLIRVQGQPADDSSTSTNIGYTTPKVIFSYQTKYDYNFVATTYVQTTTRLAPVGEGTVTTAEYVTEFGQAKASEAEA